ncbi:hypothetical protein [Trichormus variabilis]|uniref:Uncharacterized protein n=1 Tax=Trichormus variabilis SAG 1403-4b TaxID=447716 RepID=A0A3S1INH0_ANAVA|nr:hypothetical protein [Trichormus variabilis]MBD2627374.1 hypothetical protein [Trichormus variabilis FACHB-164]RUS99828.1 hypothetical protein DSM107003_04120 [Trichormus variabilis SAG 1403-4b]
MNIAKLILLACPVFLASLLLVANPAHAFSRNGVITLATPSAQTNLELTTPNLHPASNPIIDQLGCGCSTCVQTKFQMLQGKLPAADF